MLATLGSLAMYLSNYAPFFPIWKVFNSSIPPFNALQHPARFVIFLVLMLSVFGAKLISKLDNIKISNKILGHLKTAIIIALILFVFADLTKASYIITDNFKPWPMQKELIKWDDKFEYNDFYERFNLTEDQIKLLDENYFKSFEHFDTLSNKGDNKRTLDNMRLSNSMYVLSKGDIGYKGEHYFADADNGAVQLEKWSPNKIAFKANAEKDNLLVINQNYQKDWKTKEGLEVTNYNGLLAIKVPKGERTVHLYIFQNKILIGAVLSLVGVLGTFLLFKKGFFFGKI